MNYKFIPVNNDLNKAKAFANTLDPDYIRRVQRIKQKDFYIPTIDVVQKLQNDNFRPIEQITLEPYERDHAIVLGRYRMQKFSK
jgi:fibrillarin-like rRNA methylase